MPGSPLAVPLESAGRIVGADIVAAPATGRMSRGSWAWAIFHGARNPYVILVGIYVFMPYFAPTVLGDPIRGQAAVAWANTIAGWTVALTAPFLGASLDRLGPRKPWLALVTVLMVPLIASLWWTTPEGAGPDGRGLSVNAVILIAAAYASSRSLLARLAKVAGTSQPLPDAAPAR